MTDDERFIPGGMYVTDDRRVRLYVPEHWTKVSIALPRVAPSMNTNVARARGREFQRLKKEWQSEIEILLMEQRARSRISLDGYQRAAAGCFMRFAQRKDRRDSPNFRVIVDKALGDALVNFGAIPDDDDRRYFFGGVEIDPEPGAARTIIWIYLQPKEDDGQAHDDG